MLNPPVLAVSLNEVEALSAKAVRGAGAGWGLAEDVARAARWMAERGLDWSALLLRLLDAGADRLNPALRIADLLPGARPGDTWHLEGCEPIWALAVLSSALYGGDLDVDVTGEGCTARLRPDRTVSAAEPIAALAALAAGPVTMRAQASALCQPVTPAARRTAVAVEDWRTLEAFAARTYVPASARSRAAGAGGGRVDAD